MHAKKWILLTWSIPVHEQRSNTISTVDTRVLVFAIFWRDICQTSDVSEYHIVRSVIANDADDVWRAGRLPSRVAFFSH